VDEFCHPEVIDRGGRLARLPKALAEGFAANFLFCVRNYFLAKLTEIKRLITDAQYVCPSLCPTAAGLLLWAEAGRRYRSIAAEAAGECGQCHVVSVHRKLNTNLCNLFAAVRAAFAR